MTVCATREEMKDILDNLPFVDSVERTITEPCVENSKPHNLKKAPHKGCLFYNH